MSDIAPIERPRRGLGRVGRFVVVGCAAAAVHWCAAVLLVAVGDWRPVVANVPAWLVALVVSYGGHQHWTFRDQGAAWARSLRRFFLVSAAGFALNQTAYAMLLRWRPQHYGLLLAAVLVAVAALTYLASRHWAFLRSE